MKKAGAESYEELVGISYPLPGTRVRMPLANRAAQFAPFAALTGYEAAVSETARLTDERKEPGEDTQSFLNERLNIIRDRLAERPDVRVTCFTPDPRKRGGAYTSLSGKVRRIDEHERVLIMADKTKIAIDEILSIDGDLFGGQ